jgi:predicted transcriptional regulator
MANLMFHQEVEVWYVLPALKRAIAIKMKELGLKQNDIAKKLGLGKSAVSQYLKSKRASKVKFSNEFEKEITKSASNIIKKDNFMHEVENLCKKFKKNGCLCEIHKKYSKVPLRCSACA